MSHARYISAADRVEISLLHLRNVIEREMKQQSLCRCTSEKTNFNPAQPRDDHGRWTDGAGPPGAAHSPPVIHHVNIDCAEERAYAESKCFSLYLRPLDAEDGLRGLSMNSCIQGMISEQCGGSPIGLRPTGRRKDFSRDGTAAMPLLWSQVPELDSALTLAEKTRDFETAQSICDGYCIRHPADPEGFAARSFLWHMQGRLDEALADQDTCIRLDRAPNAAHYAARARLLKGLKRWPQALADWQNVADLDHTHWFGPYPHLMRAECFLALGDLDAAEAECDLVPDDYTFPGFMGKTKGSKWEVLDAVATRRRGR